MRGVKNSVAYSCGAVAGSHRFPEHRVAIYRGANVNGLQRTTLSTTDSSPALPAKPERPRWASGRSPDLRFSELERLPGIPSGFMLSSQRLQLRGSGGFSPRFPTPDGKSYIGGEGCGQGEELGYLVIDMALGSWPSTKYQLPNSQERKLTILSYFLLFSTARCSVVFRACLVAA